MISRRRLFTLMVLLLTAVFFLAACERPTPGREDTGEETATEDAGGEVSDPNVGGGVDNGYPAEQPPDTEAPTDTEQPADEVAEQPADEGDTAVPDDTAEEPASEETGDDAGAPAAGDDADEVGGGSPETGDDTDVGGGVPDTAADADDAAQTAEQPAAQQTGDILHTVQRGENLYRIGLRYGVSWVTLANYNRIAYPHRIDVGQVIRIPTGDTGGQPDPTPTPTTHVVQPGENLFRIGLRYGISWVQIAEANGLVNPNQIYVGQTLKIPVSAPGPTPPFTHTVRAGENLFRISLQYGLSWTVVAAVNNIPSPYVIYPGQVLQIPGG